MRVKSGILKLLLVGIGAIFILILSSSQLQLYVEHKFSLHQARLGDSLKKKGFTVDDLPPWSALWTNNIHLCVMFNLKEILPRRDVTDTLSYYYRPFFRNITFIFDGVHRTRPQFLPKFVNFISCNSHEGWYQQKCIRLCMSQGTEKTKGYLSIADDMFINVTKMANLPRDKIWIGSMRQEGYFRIVNPGPKGWTWGWWGPPTHSAKKLEQIINTLPDEWMEQLKKTADFPDRFRVVANSDIIYVPQLLKANLTNTINYISTRVELFCEVAICLAVNLAAPNKYVFFEEGYLWDEDRNVQTIEKTAFTAHFVHPVKLGLDEQKKVWIKVMEKQLYHVIAQYHSSFKNRMFMTNSVQN